MLQESCVANLVDRVLKSKAAGLAKVVELTDHCGTPARFDVVIVSIRDTAGVLVVERKDNPGVSVTNAYERIASHLFDTQDHLRNVDPTNVVWLEAYEGESKLDVVSMECSRTPDRKIHFRAPQWRRYTQACLSA